MSPDKALRSALRAARRGCYVTPHGKDKRPLIPKWTTTGKTRDEAQIRKWAARVDTWGFGIVCGAASGEVVLDIDKHRDGSAKALELTPTMTVRTPHGGLHLHYATSEAVAINRDGLAHGVELLGDGAFCILPESRIELTDGSTGTYHAIGAHRAIAALPASLVAPHAPKSVEAPTGASPGILDGERDVTLTKLAGALRRDGLSSTEMEAALRVRNRERCVPPLPDEQVAKIARSVGRYADGDEQEVEKLVREGRNRAEAKRRLAAELASSSFELSPIGHTLADDLAEPVPPTVYRIAELHPEDTNSLFIAQYTTGKTTSVVNLAKSLADGVPFLDRFAVNFPEGRVGYWNYEMSKPMSNLWFEDADIENRDRIVKLDLRGQRMPLNAPGVKERLIEWLAGNDVRFLIIDTLAKANAGFVDNENDNMQARDFTDALDELMASAGVRDLVVTTHMGRMKRPDGSETSRGATRYQDWADASWFLSKDSAGVRSLWADGRDVDIPSTDALKLGYDERTRRVFATGQTKRDTTENAVVDETVRKATDAIDDAENRNDYVTASALRSKLSQKARDENGVELCEKRGWLTIEKAGKSHLIRVTNDGRARRLSVPKTAAERAQRD